MLDDKERVIIAKDLLRFTRYCFARNNKKFHVNWHHQEINRALMSVFTGKTKRLIINLPPRYTKSELAVVNFMAWCIGVMPDCEFIHASYSKRLATNNAYNCRALVMSEGYQEIFPNVKLKDDSKAKDEWRTTDGGIIYATGSDGTITGYGAGKLREGFGGAIVIDDPHKAGEALSKVRRENVIDWFQNTIESRLNSPETPIIVIMQRLHEEDLSGWLEDGGNGEDWDILKIPAINKNGGALWDFKHDIYALERMRLANPYNFAGQYMQEPAPMDGGIVKREWVENNRYRLPPDDYIRIVQSWDTAYKDKDINDPSVCTTWLQTAKGHYLIDCFVIRGDYPTVKRAIKNKSLEFKPSMILIEDKASGQSLLQELKNDGLPVKGINPSGDKLTRMSTASDEISTGRVFLPESASWLSEYEAELFVFPMSKHDDQVDSTSQYLNWAMTTVKTATPKNAGRRRMRRGLGF